MVRDGRADGKSVATDQGRTPASTARAVGSGRHLGSARGPARPAGTDGASAKIERLRRVSVRRRPECVATERIGAEAAVRHSGAGSLTDPLAQLPADCGALDRATRRPKPVTETSRLIAPGLGPGRLHTGRLGSGRLGTARA